MNRLNPLLIIGLLTILLGAATISLPLSVRDRLVVKVWEDKSQRHYQAARIRVYRGEQPSWNPETEEMEWRNLLFDTKRETTCWVWYGARSDQEYTVRATSGSVDVSQVKKGCGYVNLYLHQLSSSDEPPEQRSPPAEDTQQPPEEPGPEPQTGSPEDIPEPESPLKVVFSAVLILAGVVMVVLSYAKKG